MISYPVFPDILLGMQFSEKKEKLRFEVLQFREDDNMVLVPQYIKGENGVEITGWGLIPALSTVRPKSE